MKYIKAHARIDKNKLPKPDLRLCIWIYLQRFKIILDDNKINLSIDDKKYFWMNILHQKNKFENSEEFFHFLEKKYL